MLKKILLLAIIFAFNYLKLNAEKVGSLKIQFLGILSIMIFCTMHHANNTDVYLYNLIQQTNY